MKLHVSRTHHEIEAHRTHAMILVTTRSHIIPHLRIGDQFIGFCRSIDQSCAERSSFPIAREVALNLSSASFSLLFGPGIVTFALVCSSMGGLVADGVREAGDIFGQYLLKGENQCRTLQASREPLQRFGMRPGASDSKERDRRNGHLTNALPGKHPAAT